MKDIVLFRGVRKDIVNFSEALLGMVYHDQSYGQEILNFSQYSTDFDYFISKSVGEDLVSTKRSGLFRKPYEGIHFEGFDQNSRYIFMLMYEDNEFRTYRHIETGLDTVFGVEDNISEFVDDNCGDASKWSETGVLKLNAGDGICFRPWMWHSLQNKLLQVFYIEENIDIKEESNDNSDELQE